ncbi:MAG: Rpn family recombination-promoting nuclease/putative transposase [Rhodobacter sp.]|nr:Rpn family recombination-promoting nuclease/putative transposase [Rhodobacter sp.]
MTEERSATRSGTPATPHDALFRALLTNPERAGAVLRDHLPEPIAGRLGPDPPRLIDGSFVDEALRGSQADRLLEARLTGGTPLLIYALLEHKSHPDPKTPLQIAGGSISGDATRMIILIA